jgi:hypothetical protein
MFNVHGLAKVNGGSRPAGILKRFMTAVDRVRELRRPLRSATEPRRENGPCLECDPPDDDPSSGIDDDGKGWLHHDDHDKQGVDDNGAAPIRDDRAARFDDDRAADLRQPAATDITDGPF